MTDLRAASEGGRDIGLPSGCGTGDAAHMTEMKAAIDSSATSSSSRAMTPGESENGTFSRSVSYESTDYNQH